MAQNYAALYDELNDLMDEELRSVSVTLRVMLKHMVDGVGTDTLPLKYARKVRAAYDRMVDRRAVPVDERNGGTADTQEQNDGRSTLQET